MRIPERNKDSSCKSTSPRGPRRRLVTAMEYVFIFWTPKIFLLIFGYIFPFIEAVVNTENFGREFHTSSQGLRSLWAIVNQRCWTSESGNSILLDQWFERPSGLDWMVCRGHAVLGIKLGILCMNGMRFNLLCYCISLHNSHLLILCKISTIF